MKMLTLLTAATLLVAGSAFAATAAAPAAPAAAPAAAAAAAPDHHCANNANEQKLHGAARKSFIKKCRADSTSAKK